MKLKITTVGNSAGVVLPRSLLSSLDWKKGDALYAVEGGDGLTLRSYKSEFAQQMDAALMVQHQDREVFRHLPDD